MATGHARVTYALLVDGKVEYLTVGDLGLLPQSISALTPAEAAAIPLYEHCFGVQPLKNLPSTLSVDDLASSMVGGQEATAGNVPAGYTYLAQFIFHDLTWLSHNEGQETNRASAALDMDSVLGNSTTAAEPGCPGKPDALRIGLTLGGYGDQELPLPNDVPRKPRCHQLSDSDHYPSGYPLIPDLRNEAFLQLAQTHVAFLKFYNAVAKANGFGTSRFDETAAKRVFRQHVQAVVLYDLLQKLTDPIVYADVVLGGRRRVVHPHRITDHDLFVIPIEFAAAAARFGHAMVRESYDWNATHHDGRPADLITLVTLSHQNTEPGNARLLQLPHDWVIDWQRFFDFHPLLGDAARTPVSANLICPRVVQAMASLPEHIRVTPIGKNVPVGATFNIAHETLRRQLDFKMASAQTAIDYINCRLPQELRIGKLTAGELAGQNSRTRSVFIQHPELAEVTPIWFYVLREAELRGGGERLGPFGSRLIAETIHAAIEASGQDAITAAAGWKPCLPFHDKTFTMIDLIAFSST